MRLSKRLNLFQLKRLIFIGAVFTVLAQFSLAGPRIRYSERPLILDEQIVPTATSPITLQQKSETWESMKRATLDFTAQTLGMNPHKEIYFLARDAELLYDFLLLTLKQLGKENDLKRIHLLNVSRLSMNDPHLKDYLEQEGIREHDLTSGEKEVLFVDTGFSGTIPQKISSVYSKEAQSYFQTQLICSNNPSHPSSRTFLMHLNPASVDMNPAKMITSILEYEHLPRWTPRSDAYEKNPKGKWEPAGFPEPDHRDGEVGPIQAKAYMSNLKASALQKSSLDHFQQEYQFWHELQKSLNEGKKEEILEKFKSLPTQTRIEKSKRKAAIRDFIEIVQRHYPALQNNLPDFAQSLGIKPIDTTKGKYGNKAELLQDNPDWAPYIQDPASGVPKLLESKKFQTFYNIVDTFEDAEFNNALLKAFKKLLLSPETDPETKLALRNALKVVVKNCPDQMRNEILNLFQFYSQTSEWQEELNAVLDSYKDSALYQMPYIFREPHSAKWKGFLNKLIKRLDKNDSEKYQPGQWDFDSDNWIDDKSRRRILVHLLEMFSEPWSEEFGDEAALICTKICSIYDYSNKDNIKWATVPFENHPGIKWKKARKSILENQNGNEEAIKAILKYYFSKNAVLKDNADERLLLLKNASNSILDEIFKSFSLKTFSNEEMALIARRVENLWYLTGSLVSCGYVERDWTDGSGLLVATEKWPWDLSILEALKIRDRKDRVQYLDLHPSSFNPNSLIPRVDNIQSEIDRMLSGTRSCHQ